MYKLSETVGNKIKQNNALKSDMDSRKFTQTENV